MRFFKIQKHAVFSYLDKGSVQFGFVYVFLVQKGLYYFQPIFHLFCLLDEFTKNYNTSIHFSSNILSIQSGVKEKYKKLNVLVSYNL